MDPKQANTEKRLSRPEITAAEPPVWQYPVAVGHAQQAVLGSGVQNVTFGVSAVPVAAAVRDPELVFTAADVAAFTGRKWLAREIDDFMAGNPCGYVFVEAEAGLGKTAFAAWLVKTRGYLSHFSRYSGGLTVRAALQNLSAQLVVEFGLDDYTPGGMLPDWAQDPGGFEFLLGKAAERARESRRCLVLVVDGLDEADSPSDGLPFGLPRLLPGGVYVIGTHRTGRAPGQPDTAARTVRIGQDDLRNARDVGEFLTTAAAEEVLAARLAEAGVDPTEFVRVLARRCQGVWVYLRYVLHELRIGLRRPDMIGDLPPGLRGYYANQIRDWQQHPNWQDCLLPLLATLGVAGEPLPASTLGYLAGDLNAPAVRRLCDLTFRPLLTATRAQSGAPLKYEIYHASFRQVLEADDTGQPVTSDAGLSFEVEALTDELRQATSAAHSRIADVYLRSFGGLSDDLPILAGNPAIAGADDGYPLRHLARHLHHAGRTAELHHLLAASCPLSDARALNVWFTAHDTADCILTYLDDIDRARRITAHATNQAIARHQPVPSLGTEIRYALVAASIASRAASISPTLQDLLIRAGVWSADRGLDHARRLADPANRFQALITVHQHATAAIRPVIAAGALEAATAIRNDNTRAQALAALAPHLPADQQARALEAATAIRDGDTRARVLTALAPHLPADQMDAALEAATAIRDDRARVQALTALAPHLPADQQPAAVASALDTAIAIRNEHARADALTALAPHLPPDQLARALEAATAIRNEHARADALTALASHLPADQQPAALASALDAAKAIRDGEARVQALTALAPHLPADQQPAALARAVDIATAIRDEYARVRTLTALAPHLPADQQPAVLARALEAAAALRDDHTLARALITLAPHLPADRLPRALDAATAIRHDDPRTRALTALAPHLPADQQPAVLARALEAATAIPDDHSRSRVLTALAPHLPVDQQPATLASALETATAIRDGDVHVQALTALALLLPADQQPAALARALDIAAAIRDEYACARVLTALAPHLPADQLARALEAASATRDDYARAHKLTALAPHLPADQQAAALASALEAATAIRYDYSRAQALTALAPHLSSDQLARALEAATAIRDDHARTRTLAALAPHLPADQLARALEAVTALRDDQSRAQALAALAPHLPADQLARALEAVTAIRNGATRARALTALAPHLPADKQARALEAATAIRDGDTRAGALTALAPHLPADQLAQALRAATAIRNDGARAYALTALAPHLPADQQPAALARALAAATAIRDGDTRAGALTALAPQLPADQLAHALRAATAIRDDYSRTRALTALAPHLPADQQPAALARALEAAIAIRDDRSRTRALTALAPHLPADQQPAALARALEAATAIPDDQSRTQALTALAPLLPADQLPRALEAASATGDSELVIAILIKSGSAFAIGRDNSFPALLRFSLTKATARAYCLSVITHLSSIIVKIGGVEATRETINAIVDTYAWWQ